MLIKSLTLVSIVLCSASKRIAYGFTPSSPIGIHRRDGGCHPQDHDPFGQPCIRPTVSIRKIRKKTSSPQRPPSIHLNAVITVSDIKPGRLIEYTPPSSSSSPSTTSPNPAILGVVIEPDGKKNWKILTTSGRTTSIHPRTIQHILPEISALPTDNPSHCSEILLRHESAAKTALETDRASGGTDVSDLWEMLSEEEGDNPQSKTTTTDLQTLAELLLGDSTSVSCYAARAVMLYGTESMCFRLSGKTENAFETRTVEVVEVLRKKAEAEADIEAKWEALKGRIASGTFVLEEEEGEVQEAFGRLVRLGCLAGLGVEERERMAVGDGGGGGEDLEVGKALLVNLGRKQTAEAARTLLMETGIWHRHQNLDLIRLDVPVEFAPSLLYEAQIAIDAHGDGDGDGDGQGAVEDEDEDRRMDLTHLPAFAIDDASAIEIDDALSLEILPPPPPPTSSTEPPPPHRPMHETQRIWIHIADPTRYIPINSPLAREARRRQTTIYLPTGPISMFPIHLAAGPLSLRPNVRSCALSVGIMLDADGGVDRDTPPLITPSWVKTTRLTYRRVDRMLSSGDIFGDEDDDELDGGDDGDPEGTMAVEDRPEVGEVLRRLEWVANQRLEWRKAGGSLESIDDGYGLPDMCIKAHPSSSSSSSTNNDNNNNDEWEVSITARQRYSASRIVTELMLLANEAIATFAHQNYIPLPYRSQRVTTPSEEEIEATPEGPCRSWLAIRSTSRTVVSADGGMPHEGLGLDAYVQATSPVRRFVDLAVHYQIKAFLRGDELPYTAGGLGADDGEEEEGYDNNSKEDIVRLAQEAGMVARQLERSTNDYWLREYMRRNAGEPVKVLVLAADRRSRDLYKVLLPNLGALLDYTSTRPMKVGSQVEIVPSQTGFEFKFR